MKEKIFKVFSLNKIWIFFVLAYALNEILFEHISFTVSQIRIVIIYICMAVLYEIIVKVISKK